MNYYEQCSMSVQLTLYDRSKRKHCERLLEIGLATGYYTSSNADQLNGRRKGRNLYIYIFNYIMLGRYKGDRDTNSMN